MDKHPVFLVTCEHGGNRIPPPYQSLFSACDALLQSHRGYDAGALVMAREMARRLGAALIYTTVSRLLVDINRSPRHPQLHAECVSQLPFESRQRIIERYYQPFRSQAHAVVLAAMTDGKCVIHISSHSFSPVYAGVIRTADVGLLYDPSRIGETALCKAWQSCIKAKDATLRVRRNYPYKGKSDGLTAYLRRRFPSDAYIGVELEINQAAVRADARAWRRLRIVLIESLLKAVAARSDVSSGA